MVKTIKWGAIPVLLIASIFTELAGAYQLLLDVLVCMVAIILVQRAVWMRQYVSGVGFIAIVVVFSPIFLAGKIFLLLGLACIAAFSTLLAGFRSRVPAVCAVP